MTDTNVVDAGIITPVKDEVENLPALIGSVVAQSVRPRAWIIVDDGSADGSSEIIRSVSSRLDWVHAISLEGRPEYDIGAHYASVIATGYRYLYRRWRDDLDYYMILDGDMRLTPGYLESLLEILEDDEEIFVVSGGLRIDHDGERSQEERFSDQPIGGATVIAGEFYRAISGPPLSPCVDSVTKAKARLMGGKCAYAADLDEWATQSRPTGGKENRFERGVSNGADNYYVGYHPVVILLKAIHNPTGSPLKQSIGYLYGYFSNFLRRAPRIEDPDVRAYFWRERTSEIFGRLVSKVGRNGS
ncbi:glycosyltransferase family 2 protein [Natronorubrum halophilum]|uniref:glycosyltransferase family 2 protein n=1 Tax=Natronorubrum halophilum TaxID=1702106 RepID=UPI000EF6DB99|nr:glycosyltransferase family A protein [Natronorubrum halophilum]